jgi:hypothetical protein
LTWNQGDTHAEEEVQLAQGKSVALACKDAAISEQS